MEIKDMVAKARIAQKEYELNFDQETVDKIVKTAGRTVYDNAETLAKMAVEETRMGVYEDKVAKNKGKSKAIWYNLKGKKSMGILNIDDLTGLIEIAKPMGVVAGITPTTNPIVTPMSKIMFALKTKNAIIIAPHPRSKKCSGETVRLIKEALKPFGVPEDMIQCIDEPSIDKTTELMKAADVIVATGGMPMVRSAYSSGKPSYGVGAGNVQVILDRHISYKDAAAKVVAGRIFDNGIICSGEQSFIYPKENREQVMKAFETSGAYIVPMKDKKAVVEAIFEDGHIAADVVGQSPKFIADKAKISMPDNIKVLVLEAEGYGSEDMISKEKMCPVLAAFPYDNFDEAILIAKTNLELEGNGHTAAIHSNNQGNIVKAGSELSVSRCIVNAPSATTAGGAIQNGLNVTNTLGCGSWGNNSISENFTYKHLLNITRVASLSPKIAIPTDEEIWG